MHRDGRVLAVGELRCPEQPGQPVRHRCLGGSILLSEHWFKRLVREANIWRRTPISQSGDLHPAMSSANSAEGGNAWRGSCSLPPPLRRAEAGVLPLVMRQFPFWGVTHCCVRARLAGHVNRKTEPRRGGRLWLGESGLIWLRARQKPCGVNPEGSTSQQAKSFGRRHDIGDEEGATVGARCGQAGNSITRQ